MMSTYSSTSAREARKRRAEEVMQNRIPGNLLHQSNKKKLDSKMKEVAISNKVKIRVGSQLQEDKKEDIIKFLQRNIKIFAENSNNSKGVDRKMIEHQLDVNLSTKPVKQKMQQLSADRRETTNKEVQRLLQIGSIREIK